ncbi:phytoene desaturase family protein [Sphingobacterium anhuiense]|uniref:phytoene desaturase family protein n=1 Tax=Sphingobacterium anhuiense TaxID=493780 RepID=UPI003C30EAB2
MSKTYDVIIVGSGPNGIAAGITLQKAGLSTLIIEGRDTVGGGMRTADLIEPGYRHDICSAIHPMALASPFFTALDLRAHGLEFIFTKYQAAHPFDDGSSAFLSRSISETAEGLGLDRKVYRDLIAPIVSEWDYIASATMGPFEFPKRPLLLAKFGLQALKPAATMVNKFKETHTRGLWAGMSAHAIQPFTNIASSAIGLILSAVGHKYGWPIPKGGSQAIADALVSLYTSLGGELKLNYFVENIDELAPYNTVMFDLTPKQILKIAGHRLSTAYKKKLESYRYGMGVFKMDFIIDGEIPFLDERCGDAATVHLGNTYEEIAAAESLTSKGGYPEKPFVMLAQQSKFDNSRAPAGKNTVWAYCHVPNGSIRDVSVAVENQIERFAPGFKERITAKSTMNTAQLEAYNPNYIGGDINGGIIDIRQLFTRPTVQLRPYRTSNQQIYICSSSTPPGGGVHGMCGYHAAKTVLKDRFNILL